MRPEHPGGRTLLRSIVVGLITLAAATIVAGLAVAIAWSALLRSEPDINVAFTIGFLMAAAYVAFLLTRSARSRRR